MKRKTDPNVWMDNISPAEFDQAVQEVFDFLCRDHGFKGPKSKDSAFLLNRSYQANHVAVEISFDRRDRAIEVSLVWLTEGKRPKGWKIDSSGRQFMIRLYEAAWHRKVPNPKVVALQDYAPEDTLRLWLEAWAEQLRMHFADILSDSDALFVELNETRKQQNPGPTSE